jgi:hypothetical protein
MGKVRIDQGTADRMLAGVVDPADVPSGYEAVGELLDAVRVSTRRPVHAGIHGPAVVDSRLAGGQIRKGHWMFTTTPFRPRLSILAAAMALSATTGAAFAAGLPAAAAGPATSVLHQLGIGAPAPTTHAPATQPASTHGATVSTTARTTTATGAAKGALIAGVASAGKSHAGSGDGGGEASGAGSAHGQGATISSLARSTTATGAAKGATISAAASGGKSHAGEHGHGASGHGGGKPSGAGHGHGHSAG